MCGLGRDCFIRQPGPDHRRLSRGRGSAEAPFDARPCPSLTFGPPSTATVQLQETCLQQHARTSASFRCRAEAPDAEYEPRDSMMQQQPGATSIKAGFQVPVAEVEAPGQHGLTLAVQTNPVGCMSGVCRSTSAVPKLVGPSLLGFRARACNKCRPAGGGAGLDLHSNAF